MSALAFFRINHQFEEQAEGDHKKARQYFWNQRADDKGFQYEEVYKIIKDTWKWKVDVAEHEKAAERRV